MVDLDYAPVVGRFGITAGDLPAGDVAADVDEYPDVLWCDEGTVTLVPLVTQMKVIGDPTVGPFTAGNAPIETVIDADTGRMTYNGNDTTWVLDLGSEKVNPRFDRDVASYRVEFKGMRCRGVDVKFTDFTFHAKPLSVLAEEGLTVNDLTLVSPVAATGGTPIVRGPGVVSAAVNGDGELLLTLETGEEVNAGELPVGPGGSAAGVASYLVPGTVVDQALGALTDDPESEFRIKQNTAFVQEGSAFADLGKQVGVDPTGVTECAAAINTALAGFAALGVRAFAKGTFKIATTVTIGINADMRDATLNYTGTTGTAVVVGTATSGGFVQWLDVWLPEVVAVAKTVAGWAQVAGTIGVDICNLYDSEIHFLHIKNFETNLRLYGKGRGCVYNTVHMGHLDNGKINQLLSADADGWCNENLFLGGRFSHNSEELTGGGPTTGVIHVKTAVVASGINNNVWKKPSVEGEATEYIYDIGGGYNVFEQGRYEATTPRVKWNSDAAHNLIKDGYNSGGLIEVFVAGAAGNNDIRSHSREYVTKSAGAKGLHIWENASSSDNPTDVVMLPGSREAGADPTTAYSISRSAAYTRMKKSTDAHPRIKLDHINGRVYMGNGTIDPTAHLYASGAFLVLNGFNLCFENDNTNDIGAASLRPRDIKLGRNLTIGGALDHDGTTVGFFGTTPVTKPTALTAANAGTINSGDATTDAVITAMRTRIGELEAKLQALGLIT